MLSQRLKTIITIVLMGSITIAGYIVGRHQPTPKWIENVLVPGLGWVGLALILMAIAAGVKNWIGVDPCHSKNQFDSGEDPENSD